MKLRSILFFGISVFLARPDVHAEWITLRMGLAVQDSEGGSVYPAQFELETVNIHLNSNGIGHAEVIAKTRSPRPSYATLQIQKQPQGYVLHAYLVFYPDFRKDTYRSSNHSILLPSIEDFQPRVLESEVYSFVPDVDSRQLFLAIAPKYLLKLDE